MMRDGINRDKAKLVLANQLPPEVKAQKATRVIATDAPLAHVEAQIDKAIEALDKSSLSAPT